MVTELKAARKAQTITYAPSVDTTPTSLTGVELSSVIHLSRRCIEVYMERHGLLNEKKARQRLRQGIKEDGRIEIQAPDWLKKTRFIDNAFLVINDEIALPLLPPKEPATPVRGETRPWVAVTCLVRNQRPPTTDRIVPPPSTHTLASMSEPRANSPMMQAFQQAMQNLSGPQLVAQLDITPSAVREYAALRQIAADQARLALEAEIGAASGIDDQRPVWVLRQPATTTNWIQLDGTTTVPLEGGQRQGLYRVAHVFGREQQLPNLVGISGIELADLVGFSDAVRDEYVARLQAELERQEAARRLADIVAKQGRLDLIAPDWVSGDGDFWISLGRSRVLSGRIHPELRRPLMTEHLYQRPWESVNLVELSGSELNEPLLIPKETLRQYRLWRQVGEKKAPRQLREEIASNGRAVTAPPAWISADINADYYLLLDDGAFSIKYVANDFGRPWCVDAVFPDPSKQVSPPEPAAPAATSSSLNGNGNGNAPADPTDSTAATALVMPEDVAESNEPAGAPTGEAPESAKADMPAPTGADRPADISTDAATLADAEPVISQA